MKHQLDATLCRFYFCRVTLHVSGASAHHQQYLKLVQRPLVHVLSLQVSHHISLLGPELMMGACARNMQSDPAEIKPAQCCIKLVFNLTYTMMHGSTKLKFWISFTFSGPCIEICLRILKSASGWSLLRKFWISLNCFWDRTSDRICVISGFRRGVNEFRSSWTLCSIDWHLPTIRDFSIPSAKVKQSLEDGTARLSEGVSVTYQQSAVCNNPEERRCQVTGSRRHGTEMVDTVKAVNLLPQLLHQELCCME